MLIVEMKNMNCRKCKKEDVKHHAKGMCKFCYHKVRRMSKKRDDVQE